MAIGKAFGTIIYGTLDTISMLICRWIRGVTRKTRTVILDTFKWEISPGRKLQNTFLCVENEPVGHV